jgi:diacylglycerol O-acyltransferase
VSAARALVRAVQPAPLRTPLNRRISAGRHLAIGRRPLGDLKRIGRRFDATVNDVVLAAAAGGVREFLADRGDIPLRLKTMVPVSVRRDDEKLGNRISFVFIDLPCDEPDPIQRLAEIKRAMGERKRGGEPNGADTVLQAAHYAPRAIQQTLARMMASPRTFNLVVSNIPGPPEPLYMLGCRLEETYPVVPLADHHAVSIGMTTLESQAFFGLFADRRSLPDADRLAAALDESLDELCELSR